MKRMVRGLKPKMSAVRVLALMADDIPWGDINIFDI